MEQIQIKDIESVIAYQINKDYDTDEPINFDELISLIDFLIREEQYGYKKPHNFYDFKKNVVLKGARTTLENELKVSDTEALNYLMGFPLSFNLDSFVELFNDIQIRSRFINNNDEQHVARLKFNFDKKKKLISQNFESTTHIDVEEFLEWSENKGFITLK